MKLLRMLISGMISIMKFEKNFITFNWNNVKTQIRKTLRKFIPIFCDYHVFVRWFFLSREVCLTNKLDIFGKIRNRYFRNFFVFYKSFFWKLKLYLLNSHSNSLIFCWQNIDFDIWVPVEKFYIHGCRNKTFLINDG